MPTRSLLEGLPDRRRICVMLRADGWSYEEIAEFLDIGVRMVRGDLEAASESFPGLLDHRRTDNRNRMMRLVYLMGFADGGGDPEDMTAMLDSLWDRAQMLRARMRLRDEMMSDLAARRLAENATLILDDGD